MAIYHFSAQILSRRPKPTKDGKGRPGSSSVAAAAYRAGARLEDKTRGEVYDYSKRKGMAHNEVIAPAGAAPWLSDRSALWNTVESMEKRVDAQLAREINVALPHELSHAQRLELVRGFVLENFVSRGMVADIALHDPSPEKGTSDKNYHAHILLTLRQVLPDGSDLNPVKTREWNSKDMMTAWRASWADAVNAALEGAGRKDRVDHRTLAEQRTSAEGRGDYKQAAKLNRTPEIHVGPKGRDAQVRGWSQQSATRERGARVFLPRSSDGKLVAWLQPSEVRYRSVDRGPRLSWLEEILIGNNQGLRRDILKTERQAARMSRKIDFWSRQATFWAEGHIMGAEFRHQRWKVAQDEKLRRLEAERRQRHAQMRATQIKQILLRLEAILTGAKIGREAVLRRQREVERWRQVDRDRGGRQAARGRGRERSPPR